MASPEQHTLQDLRIAYKMNHARIRDGEFPDQYFYSAFGFPMHHGEGNHKGITIPAFPSRLGIANPAMEPWKSPWTVWARGQVPPLRPNI